MILQKWISTDFKTHKCIPNDGKEVPTYRIENSHVPIIDKRTFKQVQRILELRAPRGEITRYPYVYSRKRKRCAVLERTAAMGFR